MERRIEADVEGWPTRPFEDGYDGLRQLASADFSGVVRAGGTWLFFVNGKIVGVYEGELEDVEDAQGTAHKAPHPSLPLLYAMQVTGGDTRAKYYTNDTPISEVHETLSSGSFTGYVELSENVLSGDYYQLYHGGASMSVAFVGNSGKMITGDDAFERADDEVGIYEVVDVDVDVTAVPEPEPSESSETTETAAVAAPDAEDVASGQTEETEENADVADREDAVNPAGSDQAGSDQVESNPTGATDRATSSTQRDESDDASSAGASTESSPSGASEATPVPPADDGDPADSPPAEPIPEADSRDGATEAADADASAASRTNDDDSAERPPSGRATGERRTAAEDSSSAGAGTADGAPSRGSATDGAGSRSAGADPETRGDASGRSPDASADAGVTRGEDRQRSKSAWREATTVPSLDPDHSDEPESPVTTQSTGSEGQTGSGQQSDTQSEPNARSRSKQQSRSTQQSRSAQQSRGSQQRGSTKAQASTARSGGVDEHLEQEVLEREDRIDRLQQRVENLEEDRDEIADERDRLSERVDSLTEENESLRGEIRSLEEEIEELEAAAEKAGSAGGAGGAAGDSSASSDGAMTPRAALEGTDLFVRYDSKSAPTLEAAHDGSADASEVNQNLRLDVHTQFEDDGATVDGEGFEAFLEETMAYRFVEWLVRTLPYEIRETDSASELRDLYDALPEVDRVEFHGEVARDAVEDEEGAPSETFDVVVRDKMGEALFVANMNDARDPATGRMIVDLQEAASRVKEHSMALSSAFFVTRSFFEPAALETASEATSGSLLSRDSRKSYVKLSRKQGYHLCLVEARGDDLHLNAPEL